VKIQAVSRNVESSSVGQKVATGALAALIAAGSLLPAPVMAADLALGKQVFEGKQLHPCHLQAPVATSQPRHCNCMTCLHYCGQNTAISSHVNRDDRRALWQSKADIL
jgi:hypothetical protein